MCACVHVVTLWWVVATGRESGRRAICSSEINIGRNIDYGNAASGEREGGVSLPNRDRNHTLP